MKIPFLQTQQVQKVNPLDEQKRLARTYNNINSKFRQTADFLWEHQTEEISYEQIAEEVSATINTVKVFVSQLNRCWICPLSMMPVKENSEKTGKLKYKKGFIQVIQKNLEEYERWDKKKLKTITSMNEVVEKAEKSVRQKKKVKVAQIQR